MGTRDVLHRLVDDLPEEKLDSARAALDSRRLPTTLAQARGVEEAAPRPPLSVALEPAYRRLVELARLRHDGDDQGGEPPTALAVAGASHILALVTGLVPESVSALDSAAFVPFAISPLGHGGVQLEWRLPDRYFEVEVGSGGYTRRPIGRCRHEAAYLPKGHEHGN